MRTHVDVAVHGRGAHLVVLVGGLRFRRAEPDSGREEGDARAREEGGRGAGRGEEGAEHGQGRARGWGWTR